MTQPRYGETICNTSKTPTSMGSSHVLSFKRNKDLCSILPLLLKDYQVIFLQSFQFIRIILI